MKKEELGIKSKQDYFDQIQYIFPRRRLEGRLKRHAIKNCENCKFFKRNVPLNIPGKDWSAEQACLIIGKDMPIPLEAEGFQKDSDTLRIVTGKQIGRAHV